MTSVINYETGEIVSREEVLEEGRQLGIKQMEDIRKRHVEGHARRSRF
jgi:hypothetical protein